MIYAPRNRWTAALIHLAISLLLVGLVWLAMLQAWFPDGLVEVAGMSRFVLLLLGIDIAIGPLITLLVFKPGKPKLKLDLALIAALQLAFFAYGLHAIWQTRPVYLVGVVDRLTLVFANQIESDAKSPPLPVGRPKLVGARPPKDAAERQAVIFATMSGGSDIDMRPGYYVPYPQVAPELRQRARALTTLPLSTTEQTKAFDAARRGGLTPESALALPLMSSRKVGLAILAPDDLRPVRIVGLDGFEIFGRKSNK